MEKPIGRAPATDACGGREAAMCAADRVLAKPRTPARQLAVDTIPSVGRTGEELK